MEADESGLELLITVVVAAEGDRAAREACRGLVQRVSGRILASADCSDEEPGCWSVTISRAGDEAPRHHDAAALSRQVRNFLRELGPTYTGPRVSCAPPTAWTVLDNPDLVDTLVEGGERMLVEAWLAGSLVPAAKPDPKAPQSSRQGHHAGGLTTAPAPDESDVDVAGTSCTRLGLVVDVVTERPAGAEWPARALAGRLSRRASVTGRSEHPPMVRISLDLGPADGHPEEIVAEAASELGGDGWTRPRTTGSEAVMRWSAAPTPDSGVAAVQLVASGPAVDTSPPEPETRPARAAAETSELPTPHQR